MWEFPTNGWSWGTPTLANDAVYIGSLKAVPYYGNVELTPAMYAISADSGKELWRRVPPTVDGYITGGVFSPALIEDGVVYVASIDGTLYALEE